MYLKVLGNSNKICRQKVRFVHGNSIVRIKCTSFVVITL